MTTVNGRMGQRVDEIMARDVAILRAEAVAVVQGDECRARVRHPGRVFQSARLLRTAGSGRSPSRAVSPSPAGAGEDREYTDSVADTRGVMCGASEEDEWSPPWHCWNGSNADLLVAWFIGSRLGAISKLYELHVHVRCGLGIGWFGLVNVFVGHRVSLTSVSVRSRKTI